MKSLRTIPALTKESSKELTAAVVAKTTGFAQNALFQSGYFSESNPNIAKSNDLYTRLTGQTYSYYASRAGVARQDMTRVVESFIMKIGQLVLKPLNSYSQELTATASNAKTLKDGEVARLKTNQEHLDAHVTGLAAASEGISKSGTTPAALTIEKATEEAHLPSVTPYSPLHSATEASAWEAIARSAQIFQTLDLPVVVTAVANLCSAFREDVVSDTWDLTTELSWPEGAAFTRFQYPAGIDLDLSALSSPLVLKGFGFVSGLNALGVQLKSAAAANFGERLGASTAPPARAGPPPATAGNGPFLTAEFVELLNPSLPASERRAVYSADLEVPAQSGDASAKNNRVAAEISKLAAAVVQGEVNIKALRTFIKKLQKFQQELQVVSRKIRNVQVAAAGEPYAEFSPEATRPDVNAGELVPSKDDENAKGRTGYKKLLEKIESGLKTNFQSNTEWLTKQKERLLLFKKFTDQSHDALFFDRTIEEQWKFIDCHYRYSGIEGTNRLLVEEANGGCLPAPTAST